MVEENKRAYNALLTLLNDDTQPAKKIRRSETDLKPSQASDLEAVEGMDQANADTDSAGNVDEEEEEEEEEIQVEDDNEGDQQDPFEVHFANPPSFDRPVEWKSAVVDKLPHLGNRSLFQTPSAQPNEFHTEFSPLTSKSALSKVKHRLQAPFERTNGELTTLQRELGSPLFNYKDVFFSHETWGNHSEIQNMVVLHMINHIYKTRDRVLKNTTRIREHDKQQRENRDASDEELDLRDQGFTRPKVLVLLPTRNAAYEFVSCINAVSGLSQSENRKRFKDAFYQKSVDLSSKPDDFQHTFAGNTNEVFCLGVKFTRQALKLYSSFYASDLIIASPLGLRLIVDKKDFDFLSSIELCICDQLDVSAQQSWANVKHIFEKINLVPKNPHDCDFSRVREWYLNEQAPFLRQTVLLSAFATPEMVSLYNKYCHNVAGKLRSRADISGVLADLKIHIRQIYTRLDVPSFKQDSQQRLKHFTSSLLPGLMRGAQNDGILIVAPNYTDFVVLRNYLEKHDYSYVSVSEYTNPSQLGRGRTFFANGKAKIMLYSARLHHYRRYSIKGVHNIVFYGLPDNPLFYSEFIRMLARTVLEQQIDPDLLKVHVMFSKWDALKLERIVGTRRMATFVEGPNDTHEFV